jgi:hypothetical protein
MRTGDHHHYRSADDDFNHHNHVDHNLYNHDHDDHSVAVQSPVRFLRVLQ